MRYEAGLVTGASGVVLARGPVKKGDFPWKTSRCLRSLDFISGVNIEHFYHVVSLFVHTAHDMTYFACKTTKNPCIHPN